MSLTKGFRFKTLEDKEYVISVVNKVADRYPNDIDIQGDAIVKLARIFDEGISTIGFEELPHSIQETIRMCDCEFIKYSTLQGFECYETYHKNKKTKPIGHEHDKVITACYLCKVGKSKSIREKVEADFRKKGIGRMIKLVNDLLKIDSEGAIAQIFMCQAKQFTEDEIIISPDCVHMRCPEMENELILIDEHCLKQVDPFTMNPPCRYLVAPFLRVPITIPEETKIIIDEIQQLEHEESEKKTVNAEIIDAEIVNEDDKIIEDDKYE